MLTGLDAWTGEDQFQNSSSDCSPLAGARFNEMLDAELHVDPRLPVTAIERAERNWLLQLYVSSGHTLWCIEIGDREHQKSGGLTYPKPHGISSSLTNSARGEFI